MDGCRVEQNIVRQGLPPDVQERALREAGYKLDAQSMLLALNDSRGNVRSLGARELSRVGSPEDLAPMVRVWAPDGERAAVTRGEEWMYAPAKGLENAFVERPSLAALMPDEEIIWNWRIGDDFEMSASGAYQAGFWGRLAGALTPVVWVLYRPWLADAEGVRTMGRSL